VAGAWLRTAAATPAFRAEEGLNMKKKKRKKGLSI